MTTTKVFELIKKEENRQLKNIELIASENFPSKNVLKAMGSCLTAKYAEGYPEQKSIDEFCNEYPDFIYTGNVGRYYGGCAEVDKVELYAQYMFQKAFITNYHVNVQPHSGSQANAAAYASILKPGDKILAMSLDNGGHLTHGSSVNFSGKIYQFKFYDVTPNGFIDYDDVIQKIIDFQPKLIVAGASAYSREIDFKKFKESIDTAVNIINKYDYIEYMPYFMVDMAHIAGLIVAGVHSSPFGYADIITTTTHKTLRGPRGGLIFCKPELAKKVDSAVFPGNQGGPLMHIIAAKAICAEEACTEEYKEYIKQVVKNTKAMADTFKELGYDVVTNGTDNHLFLIDLSKKFPNVTGREVQDECDKYDITLNKNCVPGEKRSPKETSGIRIGCAPMTTKGYKEDNFVDLAHTIDIIIKGIEKRKAEK